VTRCLDLAAQAAPCKARRIQSERETTVAAAAEEGLVEGVRTFERQAVLELVERWSDSMLRLALVFVRERATAEEVVQETWIAVLEGIDRFEGRSSLRTWVFTILANRARTRAAREQRSIPFSALQPEGSPLQPDSFLPAHDAWAGHWAVPPRSVPPEEVLLAAETRKHVATAIRRLPPGQRAVVTLRDVEGWSSGEVCGVLELSEANQRVLLHRGRSSVRKALARYLEETSQ
jgi:RNA polymerase sigma-70 factor (ECF subfamily)